MMIFRVLPIACCLFSLFMGVSIATWIANDSNGRFLYPLVHAWLSKYYVGKEPGPAVSDEEHRSINWKELKVHASVNDAVENLLDQLIDTYVNNWYESGISRDRDFLNEIRYQIRFACSQLISKVKAVDLPAVVAEDIVPTAALHMHRIIKYEDDLSEKVADFLAIKLLDDTHLAGRAHDDDGPSGLGERASMSTWPSQSVRHFLRELIVNALLLPCLDLIADPDTINHLLIMAFDAQKGEDGDAEQLCDSNAESSSQIAYDIWQLFGQFVHDSAPDRIEFDPEIVQEFKTAVECNNLPLLDKVVETSYQVVYQRMQTDHVIPFCQSDSFLGYLCGSPPVCVNELIDQRTMPRKSSVSGGTFSFAQFRSRLRKAIAVVSLDGSLDSEESLDNNLVDEDDLISCGSALPESSSDAILDRNDEDDVSASASIIDCPNSEPAFVIDKETRNINLWKVNVSKIQPMRDNTTGRTIYVYVIDVERTEAKEKETKSWSICR
ncbi:PXA domain protein [Ancylostoma duodenale]|uniref:PXA domain protein n=1 Tax=Ancylostoma duodenale TaxID=51022 RepID=A0A0C2GH02_9BILA|nr:PXA domain protein [Ancylostoma duodenale]